MSEVRATVAGEIPVGGFLGLITVDCAARAARASAGQGGRGRIRSLLWRNEAAFAIEDRQANTAAADIQPGQ